MLYLLDATSCSAWMKHDARFEARVTALRVEDALAVCAITRGELLFGLARLPRGKRYRQLQAEADRVFASVPCVDVGESASEEYARVKLATERAGTRVDENDLWIAATCLSMSAALVAADRDFARIPGLRVEDWTV